jgi:hypothetical protein
VKYVLYIFFPTCEVCIYWYEFGICAIVDLVIGKWNINKRTWTDKFRSTIFCATTYWFIDFNLNKRQAQTKFFFVIEDSLFSPFSPSSLSNLHHHPTTRKSKSEHQRCSYFLLVVQSSLLTSQHHPQIWTSLHNSLIVGVVLAMCSLVLFLSTTQVDPYCLARNDLLVCCPLSHWVVGYQLSCWRSDSLSFTMVRVHLDLGSSSCSCLFVHHYFLA